MLLSYQYNYGTLKTRIINLRYECEEVIPEFDEHGNLPPGVHFCEWEEFVDRFGTSDIRLRLMRGLQMAMEESFCSGLPDNLY